MGLAAKAKPTRFAPQQRLCFPTSTSSSRLCWSPLGLSSTQLRTTRQFWPDTPKKPSDSPPRSSRLPTPLQVHPNTTRSEASAGIRPQRTARPPNLESHEPRAPRLCHHDTAHLRPPILLAHTRRRTRVDTRAVAKNTQGLLAGGCGPGPVPAARRDAVGKGEGRGARAKGKGEFGPP